MKLERQKFYDKGMEDMDRVRQQYELFPYPKSQWLGKTDPASVLHATFETGYSLNFGQILSHENKQILLLGCGTMEPYAFSLVQKQAQITAVDISQQSINRARTKCFLHGIFDIKFIQSDLIEFVDKHEGQFDYVHCFGVLHHLENPQAGIEAISRLLKPEGFARIMVYSRGARLMLAPLREALKILGLSFETPNVAKEIKNFIQRLPQDHPLKKSFQNSSETGFDSGIIDSLLHAHETSFTINELVSGVEKAGLTVSAWDLSQNVLRQCEIFSGTTLEQLSLLEKMGTHLAPLTCWLRKSDKAPYKVTGYQVHPLWYWKRKKFWSPLLKRTVDLDPASSPKKELIHSRVLLPLGESL